MPNCGINNVIQWNLNNPTSIGTENNGWIIENVRL